MQILTHKKTKHFGKDESQLNSNLIHPQIQMFPEIFTGPAELSLKVQILQGHHTVLYIVQSCCLFWHKLRHL